MPDPWLSEKELEKHEEEVANHPLTKQAEAYNEAAKKEAKEAAEEQEKLRERVDEGELVEVRSNGAVSGYREVADLSEEDLAAQQVAGIKPKEEGRGGNPEDNETGPAGDKVPEPPATNADKAAEEKSKRK